MLETAAASIAATIVAGLDRRMITGRKTVTAATSAARPPRDPERNKATTSSGTGSSQILTR
jgi:hypothetical protein